MNKYQEALREIGNVVLDKSGDGYHTPKYLRDFYFMRYGTLQELVNKADSFKWIPVFERLPKEHDSIFAKLYGTDKWNNKLWRTVSDRVLVTIKYDDGTRIVKESHTRDGEWSDEKRCMNCKVEAWMPLPKAYMEKDNEKR